MAKAPITNHTITHEKSDVFDFRKDPRASSSQMEETPAIITGDELLTRFQRQQEGTVSVKLAPDEHKALRAEAEAQQTDHNVVLKKRVGALEKIFGDQV